MSGALYRNPLVSRIWIILVLYGALDIKVLGLALYNNFSPFLETVHDDFSPFPDQKRYEYGDGDEGYICGVTLVRRCSHIELVRRLFLHI